MFGSKENYGCVVIMLNSYQQNNRNWSETKAYRAHQSEFSSFQSSDYIKIIFFTYEEFIIEGCKTGNEWYRNALNLIFERTKSINR
jgi:hypothetical protein